MATRTSTVPRRDFLRPIGKAAGVSVPLVPSPTATPDPTATAPATVPTVPTMPPKSPVPPATTPPDAVPPTAEQPTPQPTPEGEAAAAVEAATAAAVVPLVPSAADRHLLSRFSFGITQAMLSDVGSGGAGAWFEKQLDPDRVYDDYANSLKSWWPNLSWTPAQMAAAEQSGEIPGWMQQNNFAAWTLVRRVYSTRQVHEVMADFWSNLLHIPAPLPKAFPHRVAYDAVIRQHALGRFDELLKAAVLHPAMLCYLDNAKSTYKLVNENLGRELLELHTVGHDAGFSEAEVSDSAMILTGYHVDINVTWAASYVELDHYTQPVEVMGFKAVNADKDGRAVTEAYLYSLAHHPATATRIARRLAVHFVSDSPSDALVAHLAAVFSVNTDIKATLRALVAHAEFKAATAAKVRTPTDDLVNTYRVLEIGMSAPNGVEGAAATAILANAGSMGQKPFDWPRPDGFPDLNDAWSSASRVLGSWKVHKNLAKGIYPNKAVTYKPAEHWLLPMPVRFDALVDHLAKRLHAQPANAQLQRAASKAVEVEPDEYVLATSTLVQKRVSDLLLALLDTPQHMMR